MSQSTTLTDEEKLTMRAAQLRNFSIKIYALEIDRCAALAAEDTVGVTEIDETITKLKAAYAAVERMS